jgi:hypothetical protein
MTGNAQSILSTNLVSFKIFGFEALTKEARPLK